MRDLQGCILPQNAIALCSIPTSVGTLIIHSENSYGLQLSPHANGMYLQSLQLHRTETGAVYIYWAQLSTRFARGWSGIQSPKRCFKQKHDDG
jgi:hypothetical protein